MKHLVAVPSRRNRELLPEIQALRAVAVGLVVLFHLWPARLPGGYVGVDVFFVISGFLITSHLLREIDATGRVRLGRFWARRIRRLLPMALLVLAATLVATVVFLPEPSWQRTVLEITASAGYGLNWLLAANAVDYFASADAPTAVQHYWSLSVEEQFYLVWPVLLLLISLAAKRVGANRHRWLAGGLATVAAASLGYSVWYTGASPSAAYFSTFTHGWEFAAGGLLALAAPAVALSRSSSLQRTRAIASTGGFVTLVICGFAFSGGTSFPGWVALVPVTATLVVITAGGPLGSRRSHVPLVSARPVQFLGDVSYSTYLWHWPLIVIAPVVLGRTLDARAKLALLAATLILAALSRHYVERPSQASQRLARSPHRAFALAVVGGIFIAGTSGVIWAGVQNRTDAAIAAAEQLVELEPDGTTGASPDPCFGAAAVLSARDCPNPYTVDRNLLLATQVVGDPVLQTISLGGSLVAGETGDLSSDTTIALVGDSHAGHYLPALTAIAERNHWRILVVRMNDCGPSAPTWRSPLAADRRPECMEWRQNLIDVLPLDKSIDVIMTSSVSHSFPKTAPDAASRAVISGAFETTWRAWTDAGKQVVVVADVPGPGMLTIGGEARECVATSATDVDPCTVPRDQVISFDPALVAATEFGDESLRLVDFTDGYCDADVCHSVIGGLVVYGGGSHISQLFSESLAPYLEPYLLDGVEAAEARRTS